jgi:hypothetical protein
VVKGALKRRKTDRDSFERAKGGCLGLYGKTKGTGWGRLYPKIPLDKNALLMIILIIKKKEVIRIAYL